MTFAHCYMWLKSLSRKHVTVGPTRLFSCSCRHGNRRADDQRDHDFANAVERRFVPCLGFGGAASHLVRAIWDDVRQSLKDVVQAESPKERLDVERSFRRSHLRQACRNENYLKSEDSDFCTILKTTTMRRIASG